MRGLVWFLVVTALAVALGLVARMNEGYVLVVAPPYRIELSLALVVIVIVAAFALLYYLLRLIIHTLRLPAYVERFRRDQRRSRGEEAMRGALQAYLEGRYGRAHRLAERSFDLGEAPALAALIAARSAHSLRDSPRRDTWLARADTSDGEVRTARLATQAEMLIDERRFEDARAVLKELHQNGPRHVATLRLMLKAEQGLQNWDEVLRLVKQLEKRNALTPDFAQQLTTTATVENLRRKSLDADQMRQFWKTVSAQERAAPRVAETAARLFMRLGDCRTMHAIIEEALAVEWTESLVILYSECIHTDSLARLERAERWLPDHPRDAALLLSLGRLCAQRELWGKAQSYFDASLSEQPSRATHIEIARLLDRLGKTDLAHEHYRAASDPEVPA